MAKIEELLGIASDSAEPPHKLKVGDKLYHPQGITMEVHEVDGESVTIEWQDAQGWHRSTGSGADLQKAYGR